MKCPRCRLCEMRIEKRSGGEVTRKCPECGQEIAEKAQEPNSFDKSDTTIKKAKTRPIFKNAGGIAFCDDAVQP